MRNALALLAVLALAACGGPRGPVTPYSRAAGWHEVMVVEVREVWDLLEWHVDDLPPQMSHVVRVRVIEGPASLQGTEISLPYDAYACGDDREPYRRPPSVGTTVTMTPSQWVTAPRSRRR